MAIRPLSGVRSSCATRVSAPGCAARVLPDLAAARRPALRSGRRVFGRDAAAKGAGLRGRTRSLRTSFDTYAVINGRRAIA